MFSPLECRDVLLPLLIDQLSGQLDDNSSKPDHEASSQLLSYILEVLDRKDVVSQIVTDVEHRAQSSRNLGQKGPHSPPGPGQFRTRVLDASMLEVFKEAFPG